MRRLALVLPAALAMLCVAVPAVGAATWRPDVDAARAWAGTRPGVVSVEIRTGGRRDGFRTGRTVPAASLMKTLFLVAHLRRGDVRNRPLHLDERRLLSRMIRRSDDVAATRLRDDLGHARVRRAARAAGMRDLRLNPAWGGSRTSARDQASLMARLPRLLPDRHRAYARGLLRTIVQRQSWGIGDVRLPGWTVMFKGGWGSGSGAVDHQAVLLERDGRRIAIAVLTTGHPSHAAGKRTLRGVFARLLHGLPRAR
jgi:hypothetical protein